MSLAPGSRIGPYEIVAPLGAGGMGEVYRARDAKLQRDVAIKVLPDLFAQDAERLARFEREARTLASLNHPNIAAIFGIEESKGTCALVMELVDGEDLSVAIARGPMPLADAVSIAKQLVDALEAAHESGIIHRDLKPANVKVRDNGAVKVLDFGLAKAMSSGSEDSGLPRDVANSPTLTARATQMGMILGTAAYMAPEQAKGKSVDRRADIWAFGVVLFEMLTGRRAFGGDDVSDVMASVLKTDPDWTALPADLPPSVRRLLGRCLEKVPRARLGAISDARFDLNETEPAAVAPVAPNVVVVRPSLVTRLWPAAAGIVVTAVIAALLWPASKTDVSAGITRVSVVAPPGTTIYPDSTQVVISPNGKMVAFVTGDVSKPTALWVRSLDSLAARQLDGTDGALLPFWSPDSRRIGFFTQDKLKTVAVQGGRVEPLCDIFGTGGRGATWSVSNVIVFTRDASGPLYRISANGGEATAATSLDAARKQSGHRFPVSLPDGDHFLFAALPGHGGKFDIFAGSLRDGTTTLIGSMESAPVYAEPGWLLYARQGILAAQPFDPRTLKVTGEAVSLDDEPTSILDPATSFTAGYTTSVSASGSLAYYSSASANTTATWIDASGKPTGAITLPVGIYSGLTISPDGTHAALVKSTSATESSLWLVDLTHGNAVPLSSGRGRNDSPVWSPDSSRVIFASDRDGAEDFYVKNVADASPEQPLYRSPVLFKNPTGWSRDGRWIVFTQMDPGTAQNIYLLPSSGTEPPVPFLHGPLREDDGRPSPDGHWLAYASDDTGRYELYVQSFPEPGHKQQVSQEGVVGGGWTHDGRHLLFVGSDGKTLWRADVESGPSLKVSAPVRIAALPSGIISFDAMPDGQRFLALIPEHVGPGSVTVVLNWRAALEKKR
jgi:serine/threonine protein kinase/Tol biopolymer transport system component